MITETDKLAIITLVIATIAGIATPITLLFMEEFMDTTPKIKLGKIKDPHKLSLSQLEGRDWYEIHLDTEGITKKQLEVWGVKFIKECEAQKINMLYIDHHKQTVQVKIPFNTLITLPLKTILETTVKSYIKETYSLDKLRQRAADHEW